MLDLTGDILNWLTAGVFFPLLFLPLAALVNARRKKRDSIVDTATWAILVGNIYFSGLLFVYLVPALSGGFSNPARYILAGLFLALTLLVALSGGPVRMSNILTPVFETIIRVTGRTVMWLLIVMALVQFGVVVLRYVFGINYIFMQESITYMHGAVFLLAGGYALLTDDHVRVDIFYREASPRRKALVDLAGTYFLLFPVCLLLLWTASPYVANSWAVGEGSNESSGIKGLFILKSFIPAFAMLMSMAGFVIAARASAILREPR